MTVKIQLERLPEVGGKRTCGVCTHANVCALLRAIAPLVESFEKRKPFEVDQLAVICIEFTPIY